MRSTTLALTFLCAACAQQPSSKEQAMIDTVEKHVKLPKGAGPLRCYTRYYTVVRGKDLEKLLGGSNSLGVSELLVGRYREPDVNAGERAGIEWLTDTSALPEIHDAGCTDMQVWYTSGWPAEKVIALCSLDFSGNMPEEIGGKPLTC